MELPREKVEESAFFTSEIHAEFYPQKSEPTKYTVHLWAIDEYRYIIEDFQTPARGLLNMFGPPVATAGPCVTKGWTSRL